MYILKWLKKVKLYCLTNIYIYNESYIFLKFILKKNMYWIISNMYFKLNNYQLEILNLFLIRRLRGEPVYYILGYLNFLSLSYKIYSDIFIPRQDTEIMVRYVINLIKINNFSKILDLGTGSGVIALSIAKYCNKVIVLGLDLNILSINLAKFNSFRLNLNNVCFKYSYWFNYIKYRNKKFNIIISNPPYINKFSSFYFEDLRFESDISLYSYNGISDIYYIISNSYNYLYNLGWLIIEHCFTQVDYVNYIFSKFNYYNIFNYKDINNKYRFTVGQKNE